MANPAVETQLFDVNLINDQVNVLLRRRALQQISGAASMGMLAIGAAFALLMGMHFKEALNVQNGIRPIQAELGQEQKTAAALDADREAAIASARAVAALLPMARARIAWAPKLAAVANLLPVGAGLVSLTATQHGVLFIRPPTAAAAADEANAPQMMITILYDRFAGGEEPPLGFPEKLKRSPLFMNKFNFVQLQRVERDNWQGKQVSLLRTYARGAAK